MRKMGTKWRVFGIGIVLFALFWCSVAQMPTANAAQDDANKKEVGAIWCKDYPSDPDLPYSDLDAHGKQYWWGYKNGFYSEMIARGWGGSDSGVHGDGMARDRDLDVRGNPNTPWGEKVDIVYFSGHGGIGNLNSIKYSDGSMTDAGEDGWGQYDMEWLIFSACYALGLDATGALLAWGDNQPTGLHVLNGYKTYAYQYNYWDAGDFWPRGKRYAVYLFDPTDNGVGYAWQRATYADAQQSWGHTQWIRGASVAAAADVYEFGQYVRTEYYFYQDTINNPMRDPIDKNYGDIQFDCYMVYYEWLVDWPH
ncbi:MAG: DUF6345 domain-containing protein [Thermoplasmata archaeon]